MTIHVCISSTQLWQNLGISKGRIAGKTQIGGTAHWDRFIFNPAEWLALEPTSGQWLEKKSLIAFNTFWESSNQYVHRENNYDKATDAITSKKSAGKLTSLHSRGMYVTMNCRHEREHFKCCWQENAGGLNEKSSVNNGTKLIRRRAILVKYSLRRYYACIPNSWENTYDVSRVCSWILGL